MMRSALKSKTLWFSVSLAVLGVLEQQFSLVEHLLPEEYRGLALIGVGVTVAVLRIVTTESVLDK
jgi:hypothetical protein